MSAGRPGDDDAPGLDDPPKDEARGGARPGDHGPGRDQEGGRLEGEPDDDHRSVIEARTAWIAALAAVLLAALFIPGPHDFPLDDAWIHLSYAKSVRLGDGPSYNPGDHELGFSSPLWVALLSVWPISGDPLRPVQLLGVLLHGLSAWIAARLGLRLARARASAERPQPLSSLTVLTGVLVAASPGLVRAATSGMEVSLTAAACLAVAWVVMFGRPGPAALLGALAVWARPEALGFVVALAGVLAPWRWRAGRRGAPVWAPVAAAIGGLLALGSWLVYCQVVAGQWWPNAQYVKGEGGGLEGLDYLAQQVLPWQPWLVSLTGVVMLGLALRRDLIERRPELLAVVVAALATTVAIALSRPLHPGVLFYESRYFAPFVALPVVALPFGLPRARPWLGWALVLPVAVVCGLQIDALHDRAQAQRADTHQLHGALAEQLADEGFPRDARVAVEGAGAPRFFAPRSMTIIDLVGLNDHELARRHDDVKAKLCHLVRSRPTHLAIPADWIDAFTPVLALRPIARFDDPVYTQVDPPRALTLVLLAVDEIHPAWVEGCGRPE
ncbi:MAG: hypothetical protein H6712_28320 [Myxococcales bacterium]|nr:hypothetical protein [Myxococcales bacterium]